MANTMALQRVQPGERDTIFIYKLTLTGNYVQAVRGANTGEVLLPVSASNPNDEPKATAAQYDRGYIINGLGGFAGEIIPGADSTHWLLKVFSTTPGTELSAGAYPAGITGDVDTFIAFEARNYR